MSMTSFSISREEHAHREVDVDEEEVTFMEGFTFTANRSDYDDGSLEEAELSPPQHTLFGNFTRREEQCEQRDTKYLKTIEAWGPLTEGEEEGEEEEGEEEDSSIECKDALEGLFSVIIRCGGRRDQLKGWKVEWKGSPGRFYYYKEGKGHSFSSRTEVARWLELPGAPAVGQYLLDNIASAKECEDALERLASYVIKCGGRREQVKGWEARRLPSGGRPWVYYSERGERFNSRSNIARYFKLLSTPSKRNPKSRPCGRAPKGKHWDRRKGAWVNK